MPSESCVETFRQNHPAAFVKSVDHVHRVSCEVLGWVLHHRGPPFQVTVVGSNRSLAFFSCFQGFGAERDDGQARWNSQRLLRPRETGIDAPRVNLNIHASKRTDCVNNKEYILRFGYRAKLVHRVCRARGRVHMHDQEGLVRRGGELSLDLTWVRHAAPRHLEHIDLRAKCARDFRKPVSEVPA